MKRFALFVLFALMIVMPVAAQGDDPIVTDETPVIVSIEGATAEEEPVLEVRGDLARVIIIVGVLSGLGVAIWSGIRTGQLSNKLNQYVDTTVANIELTSELELQFSRLPLARQEAISKLIDVADPLARFWPGDLDDKTVAWLREIVDDLPMRDKPVLPQG